MKRISTDAEYLDDGTVTVDADGIPVTISGKADKSYVDDAATQALNTAIENIDLKKFFRGYIHIDNHLDEVEETGGWTQQYTPLADKGYPEQAGGFFMSFKSGLGQYRIDFYITFTGKLYVRSRTSAGVWRAWALSSDPALFSRVTQLESKVTDLETSGAPAALLTPISLDWTHWGDSLTDGQYANGTTQYWTDLLADHTGQVHWNEGWGGQRTEEIAARAGSSPSIVTVDGNSIPASGTSVTVSNIVNRPVHQAGRQVHGTLAGRAGYIEMRSSVISFTPTSGTAATSCPANSRFYASSDAANTPARHVTIWTGYNDRWDRTPEQILSHIDGIVQRHSVGGNRRILIMQVPRGAAAAPDSATNQRVDAYNTALKQAFPTMYMPICDLLQTDEAATLAGISFTEEDQLDIAEGKNPRSFRTDSVHFNDAGHKAIAELVWQEIQSRGWAA